MTTTTRANDRPDRNLGDAAAIVDAALAAARPEELTEGRFAVTVPAGGRLELVDVTADLEREEPTPRRKHETTRHYTAASLAQYVNVHNLGDGSAVLFASDEQFTVVAILNSPTRDEAGWSDHRATLGLRLTPAWRRWAANDRKMLNQVAFAEHIEESLLDIVEPDSATLLELAQTFEAQRSAAFKSATLLASGERQFNYTEELTAAAGRQGQLTIPAAFTLGLQPFDGAELYKVTARLRYRLNDGALSLGYLLDRPEDVLRAAFDDSVAAIEASTSLTSYRGAPPA